MTSKEFNNKHISFQLSVVNKYGVLIGNREQSEHIHVALFAVGDLYIEVYIINAKQAYQIVAIDDMNCSTLDLYLENIDIHNLMKI